MLLYNIGNFKDTYLASAMDASQLTMDVALNTGVNMPDAPCLAIISRSRGLYDLKRGEIIKVTVKSLDHFTIERAQSNTSAATHAAGELVLFNVFAEHIQNFTDGYRTLSRFITLALGNIGSGVIRTTYDPSTDLQVTATTGMVIRTLAGHAIVNYLPARLEVYQNNTLVAPVTNPRIDLVQIDQDSVVSVKTGTEAASPVAPTPDSDAIALAQVALTVGQTTIITGNITDERVFY